MFETEAALAWPAMPYRAPVYAADTSEIGSAESLLGDEDADIFHGIVVKRREDRKLVEIPAVRIKKITAAGVLTDLGSDDVGALQPYREERWYHIGWGGLFRKHPEWDRTSGT
ncbi:MAG: hypothetical protein E6I69_12935 [Chloroflexi bacterium]|nr:MAG: hypothetical protein E6I69_12935 [Chloroflexota bacterium]TME90474.1 MAG: hypothetical protein E6I34_13215 [Chloroflexota bacterium]